MKHFLPFLLLSFAALASGQTLPYYCTDGSRLNISFSTANDGRPQATLYLTSGELNLPQVPAASGARYRAGENQLHVKGENILIEDSTGNRRACHVGIAPPPKVAAPVSTVSGFLDITGRVTYFQPLALPPDAVLIIRVQNIARRGAAARQLAEQRIELAGQQVPIAFTTPIDRDLIGKNAHITVSARIEHQGKPLFVSDKIYPALINGQPQPQEINLRPARRSKKT